MRLRSVRPNIALMRRALTVVFASLLALAVIAPAAQGTTKYRYWQDLNVSGSFPGQIGLAIAYEDKNGNGKFKPRSAVSYNLHVQTSCDPGGEADLHLSGNAYSKYNYFRPELRKGRFAHRFEDQAEQPVLSPLKGDLNGTVLKKQKRGKRVTRTARVNGAFDVEGTFEGNCTSSGSYSATQCKRWRSKRDRPRWYREWKAPICSEDPW
jgi:hypothetical protein